MALDALFLRALTAELRQELLGAKIEKVTMPAKREVVLSFRKKNLLIGGSAGSNRLLLTGGDFEKPQEPPMFCMLLRKHLIGARVEDITQPEGERVVEFSLSAPGMFGEGEKRRLIAELFGPSVNLILTDGEGVITDCLIRLGGVDEKRAILPGMVYRLPPAQEKVSLLTADLPALCAQAEADMLLAKWLQRTFSGLSPLVARELAYRAAGDTTAPVYAVPRERLAEVLAEIAARRPEPWLLVNPAGQAAEFSWLPLTQYGPGYENRRLESFSALLDTYWAERTQAERQRARTGDLLRTVKAQRDRVERRLAAQREELAATANRETLRENGDLIMTNLYALKKGQTTLVAEDYYRGGQRTIRLDPLKTPQQNAARYYKDYNRMKSAEQHLTQRIALGEEELSYLESVLDEVERADSARTVAEIRAELVSAGVLREAKGKKREKLRSEGPMVFQSATGFTIRVGRNNLQNDRLTLREAAKTDLWLHVQKIHGSHVVIACEGRTPDEATLREAASLAVTYSAARASGKTAVDYTLVKYVKKPNGARPGMVIYTDYKTILAEPRQ